MLGPIYTNEEQDRIKEIQQLSYQEMLQHNRFSPIGHAYHKGKVGQYFSERFEVLGRRFCEDEKRRISQEVGW